MKLKIIPKRSENQGVENFVTKFSSLKLINLFLKTPMPALVGKEALDGTDDEDDLSECIDHILSYVGRNGGWTVTGWMKRGNIINKNGGKDEGAGESSEKKTASGTV